MYRFNHLNIKQEHDFDMNEDGNDNIKEQQHVIRSSVNHVTQSVPISTHPKPSQQSVQSCTKIKKEEESGEIVKLEWDGDECACLECRVEREIKIEFNQTNATKNAHINNCLRPSEDNKGVKKEEDDDKSDFHQVDSNAKINDESEGHESEIDDDEYKTEIEGEESSDDDTKAEVNVQSYPEDLLHNKSSRNSNKSQKGNNFCVQYGKTFTRPCHLTRHIQTHSGKRPFKCPWEGCNKTFVNKRNMTRHLPIHTREQPHVCEHCGQKFRYQLELTVHIRAHTGQRPFACLWEGCNETFARKDNMQRHLQIHTGEVSKSHVCEHCAKRFRDLSKLTRHIRTHTGERPFACPWNGCNKTFARNDKMQLHYKSHTGQLPHACEQCDKKFRFPFKLVDHIRASHTGERPFVCHLNGCTKKYKHKETLVHHQKTKHN